MQQFKNKKNKVVLVNQFCFSYFYVFVEWIPFQGC